MRRLLVTHGLLLAAVIAAVAGTGLYRLGVAGLFLWAALTPFVTLLAWLINQPMENAVTSRYIRDARRRLEERPDLMVIGITGSYGKTSTKNFLHALLSARYNVLMTPESFNTTLGVVRTVRERLQPSHQVLLAEMGAKNPGDIREICDLVHPGYGVITAIGEQHLETFQTVENIIATKFELADAVPAGGAVFLNADNAYIREPGRPSSCGQSRDLRRRGGKRGRVHGPRQGGGAARLLLHRPRPPGRRSGLRPVCWVLTTSRTSSAVSPWPIPWVSLWRS